MFTIDSNTNKITVVQGDSGIFDIILNNHIFEDGDRVYFTVKRNLNDRKNAIQKIVSEFNYDTAKFILAAEDTRIPVGAYVYDIKCTLADGRADTIIQPSSFEVIQGVTYE